MNRLNKVKSKNCKFQKLYIFVSKITDENSSQFQIELDLEVFYTTDGKTSPILLKLLTIVNCSINKVKGNLT